MMQLCLQVAGLSTECYRMYEALDSGCVPILVDELGGYTTAAEQYRFILRGPDGAAAPSPASSSPIACNRPDLLLLERRLRGVRVDIAGQERRRREQAARAASFLAPWFDHVRWSAGAARLARASSEHVL